MITIGDVKKILPHIPDQALVSFDDENVGISFAEKFYCLDEDINGELRFREEQADLSYRKIEIEKIQQEFTK